jgi:hypothetical protein
MGIIVGDSLSWLWDLLRAATLDGDGDVELGVGAVGAGGGIPRPWVIGGQGRRWRATGGGVERMRDGSESETGEK